MCHNSDGTFPPSLPGGMFSGLSILTDDQHYKLASHEWTHPLVEQFALYVCLIVNVGLLYPTLVEESVHT